MITVHQAGPMVDGLQKCCQCGYILSDYRNSFSPDPDYIPLGWEHGKYVLVEGNCSAVSENIPDDSIVCWASI